MVFSFWSSIKSQSFARTFAGKFAFFDDGNTVDENVFHTGGVLMWLSKSGAILDGVRIEDDEIGPETFVNFAPAGDSKRAGGERGHAANGFFEAKHAEFIDVMMQGAGVVSVTARMG